MSGKCGQTYRIAATADPSPCNALVQTPAGLLVPSTALEGVPATPTDPVGTGRSVAVDVTAPDGEDCPAVWEVGARLAAPSDMQPLSGPAVNLTATPSGTWVDTGANVAIPEAGVYVVSGQVHGALSCPPSATAYITARLVDGGGTVLVDSMVLLINNTNAPTTQLISLHATAPIMTRLTAAGPTTVRLQVQRTNVAAASDFAVVFNGTDGNTHLLHWKVSD